MKLFALLSLLLVVGCSQQMSEVRILTLDDALLTNEEIVEEQSSEEAYQSFYQDVYRPAQSHTVFLPDGETINLHCI